MSDELTADRWVPLAELCALADPQRDSFQDLRLAQENLDAFREAATPAVVLDLIQHARRAEHPGRVHLTLARARIAALEVELLQARADAQIDGRAHRMLPDMVDALMGVVAEANLWRGMRDRGGTLPRRRCDHRSPESPRMTGETETGMPIDWCGTCGAFRGGGEEGVWILPRWTFEALP